MRRAVYAAVLLLLASIVVFFSLRVAPGDVVETLTNPLQYRDQTREELEARLGLDKPLVVQYGLFVKNVLTGDIGHSLVSGRRITTVIVEAGKNTAILAAAAAFLTYMISIPLGALAAWRRNSSLDHGTMALAVLGMGIPNFFLALLLIQVFAVKLGWLPAAGSEGFNTLILPAVVLAVEGIAINLRLVRSSVLDELGRDYIRSLRARGFSDGRVMWRHSLRNALPPVIGLSGVIMRTLIGYTLVVEVIFRWPGLGFTLVDSVLKRDYSQAQMLALLLVFAVIVVNLLADIGHHIADPRVRERARAT